MKTTLEHTLATVALDEIDLPTRQSMAGERFHRRQHNHTYEDQRIEKILKGSAGRDWNDVHSVICREFDPRTSGGDHIRFELPHLVELGGSCGDGVLRDAAGERSFKHYFVDDSGKLQAAPKLSRKIRDSEREENPNIRPIDDCHELQRIKGIWYRVTFREITQELQTGDALDRASLRASSRFELEDGERLKQLPERYNKERQRFERQTFLPIEKVQLSSSEIRRLRLHS